jgi:Ca-activated chloride channel family protein
VRRTPRGATRWTPILARLFRACLTFVFFTASVSRATGEPPQVPAFKTGVDLVNLGVTVVDRRGNLISGLTADEVEIWEDGQKQTIRYFSSGEAPPPMPAMHLGLLLDVSGSMEEDIAFSKTASIKFLNMLTDAVDVTVVDFDTEVRTARYSQNEFARLIERIRLKKAGGYTALYDAIGTYLDGAGSQEGRKIMLVYTDGGDSRSSLRWHELQDLMKASDVTIYVIGELEHQSMSSRNEQRMILQQMADLTGGQAFFPTAIKDLDKAYEKVLAEIRAQYTIGYQSTNTTTDGAWRKVDVKVVRKDAKDLRVRARKGYFALYKK